MGKLLASKAVLQPQVNVTDCPSGKSWRLIFDLKTKKVLALFYADIPMKISGKSLFVSDPITDKFTSLQGMKECLDKIVELGLDIELISPQVKVHINRAAQENQIRSLDSARNRKLSLMK